MRIFFLCPSTADATAAGARERLPSIGTASVGESTLVAFGLVVACGCRCATSGRTLSGRGQRGGEQGNEEKSMFGDHHVDRVAVKMWCVVCFVFGVGVGLSVFFRISGVSVVYTGITYFDFFNGNISSQ